MSQHFFEKPILNPPYSHPGRHLGLIDRQPTDRIIETRRRSDLTTPVTQTKKQRRNKKQGSLDFREQDASPEQQQEYNPTPI
jgi:type III restriction enzyme